MATFADYPSQTMASNNNDFPLFSYQEEWNDQSYQSYPDQSYMNTTTFDSYQAHSAYIQPDQYPFDPTFQSKNLAQSHDAYHSPAHSAAQSFDVQQPPVLSSTSDSGASAPSTISSAMGSPSIQPQVANGWGQQHNMGMLPDIVHPDGLGQNVFASTGFDIETIPVADKGCVGELNTISSSQQAQSVFPFNFLSHPSSFGLLEDPSSFHLDFSQARFPATVPPASSGLSTNVPLAITPPTRDSMSPNDSFFKSPTTPASATSPVLERVKGKRTSTVTHSSAPKRPRGSSPLTQAMSYNEADLPARPQAPLPTFSSPFFSQSSGIFVPPLESSYPALIQPFSPTQFTGNPFPEAQPVQSPQNLVYPHAPSPAPSRLSVHSPRQPSGKMPSSASPYMHTQGWQPYPAYNRARQHSVSSEQSRHSGSSEDSNKGLCPIATCGRHVKDLKAHMLTHQNERPEKCPIPSCEYHTKGFARKYDKNRHTLTHYKGTMVCGFCPGSGSAAEKSFNRADVFKRHLTSVHGVEQTPPNARRKSPSATNGRKSFGREVSGMCSTCGVTFASAQDFYEHLDDCVLRVVQQADPAEAVNEKLLGSVAQDQDVQETMEKHMLPTTLDMNGPTSFDQEDDADDDEEVDEDDSNDTTYGSRNGKSGKGSIKSRKSAGNSS